MYLAMLMDDTCLPLISLDDRFALIKHEWCVWQKEDNGQYPGIAQWLQVRAILLSGGNSQDLSVQSCFQSVAFWFCEFNDHAPTDRSFCRFVVEECLEGKLEKPGLVLTLLDEACQWQEATGRGSTCLFVLAEQVQHLLKDDRVVQTAELFAMVLSMVQVSLKTFAYMLTYDQWFQSIFLDRTSIFAQNKRFGKAWLHTLTAMLPHETPDVLQIHGKLLFDQAVDDAYRAHLTDIRTALLRMGMEASLQHMPTRLGQPMASKNSAVTHGSTASTNMHLSSSALLDASSLEKIMKSYTGSECATVSLSHDVIFKPVWFKQTFLPSLINWSPPPHLATARHDLIKLIHSKGKLPLSLHQEYKKQQ
ncbi:hypothetical protein DM01DRAFT_1131494 [Hesseltinella vesiculosa]|uniref:Uncharacterized protein n=1 Tax=Hesseltinella vesiculosa TaxID=101127 RepID=A0A1X2G967_9FUNG|nr:hypothetical protein DM01DRAFT_1131494 [Hesseltinella vesiculosa]